MINVDDDKGSSQSTNHKSPAAMTAEADLKCQDVVFVAESNQNQVLAA